MSHQYLLIGAGLMGRAIAWDLLRQHDTAQVTVIDQKKAALDITKGFLGDDPRVTCRQLEVNRISALDEQMKTADVAIAAAHYALNLEITKTAIRTRTHLCDLGGNSAVVDQQLALTDEARGAGITVVPDCGLAPGMVSVITRWGIDKFPWTETVKIRVGGLPSRPQGPLAYGRLFSVEGLINEYVEPVRVLRDGQIMMVSPLDELEEIEFPQPLGKLEAFTTSGGASTMVETFAGRLRNLDYKTIRYPGHCRIMRALLELGFFSSNPVKVDNLEIVPRRVSAHLLEQNVPLCEDDITLMRIVFVGEGRQHRVEMIDRATSLPRMTSMMRTTGFPASIIATMLARGQITMRGVQPQERCVPADIFIAELGNRGLVVHGTDAA